MPNLAQKIWARLLAEKLFSDHPPADLRLVRTYAGHHQRSAGAWSWCFWSDDTPIVMDIGSQWPASKVLRAEKLSVHINEHTLQTSIQIERVET